MVLVAELCFFNDLIHPVVVFCVDATLVAVLVYPAVKESLLRL